MTQLYGFIRSKLSLIVRFPSFLLLIECCTCNIVICVRHGVGIISISWTENNEPSDDDFFTDVMVCFLLKSKRRTPLE